MKKTLILLLLVVCALIIDGTLTYEIFDFRHGSGSAWPYILLALVLLAVILLSDSSKKNENRDTSG